VIVSAAALSAAVHQCEAAASEAAPEDSAAGLPARAAVAVRPVCEAAALVVVAVAVVVVVVAAVVVVAVAVVAVVVVEGDNEL
jgi:hypothetical protein